MAKLFATLCLSFAFFVASAVAQMAPGGSQGTQNSSPSMSQQGSQTGDRQGQQPGMDQSSNTNEHQNNGEHKLKGCVESEGGQYVLNTKKGKEIALTGQDVSAHVGHEVSLKGTWESGSGMSSTSSSNTGSAASSGKTFNVTDVKMISDTCKSKNNSGNMGTSGSSSPSGTGTSSPSGNGTSQQPPQ